MGDIETLYHTDPAAALEKWMQTRQAAREQLQSGMRAATAVKPFFPCPWWLAQFLALRDELMAAWLARNGADQTLIDVAAEAYTLMQGWLGELIDRTALANAGSRREPGREQVRLDDAQAIDQAMQMVERFHGVFLRTLKLLQDMRRVSPRVVVRRAGQVNVGQHQVNVSGSHPPTPAATDTLP